MKRQFDLGDFKTVWKHFTLQIVQTHDCKFIDSRRIYEISSFMIIESKAKPTTRNLEKFK